MNKKIFSTIIVLSLFVLLIQQPVLADLAEKIENGDISLDVKVDVSVEDISLTNLEPFEFVKEVDGLIEGDELANKVGLNEGDAINEDTTWLMFNYGNKLYYIPQKPIRDNVSYDDIANAGGTDNETVMVGDSEYRVRLIESQKEWERLFFPIHENNTKYSDFIYLNDEDFRKIVNQSDRLEEDELYSDSDLGLNNQKFWVDFKEETENLVGNEVDSYHIRDGDNSSYQWRPLLEHFIPHYDGD